MIFAALIAALTFLCGEALVPSPFPGRSAALLTYYEDLGPGTCDTQQPHVTVLKKTKSECERECTYSYVGGNLRWRMFCGPMGANYYCTCTGYAHSERNPRNTCLLYATTNIAAVNTTEGYNCYKRRLRASPAPTVAPTVPSISPTLSPTTPFPTTRALSPDNAVLLTGENPSYNLTVTEMGNYCSNIRNGKSLFSTPGTLPGYCDMPNSILPGGKKFAIGDFAIEFDFIGYNPIATKTSYYLKGMFFAKTSVFKNGRLFGQYGQDTDAIVGPKAWVDEQGNVGFQMRRGHGGVGGVQCQVWNHTHPMPFKTTIRMKFERVGNTLAIYKDGLMQCSTNITPGMYNKVLFEDAPLRWFADAPGNPNSGYVAPWPQHQLTYWHQLNADIFNIVLSGPATHKLATPTPVANPSGIVQMHIVGDGCCRFPGWSAPVTHPGVTTEADCNALCMAESWCIAADLDLSYGTRRHMCALFEDLSGSLTGADVYTSCGNQWIKCWAKMPTNYVPITLTSLGSGGCGNKHQLPNIASPSGARNNPVQECARNAMKDRVNCPANMVMLGGNNNNVWECYCCSTFLFTNTSISNPAVITHFALYSATLPPTPPTHSPTGPSPAPTWRPTRPPTDTPAPTKADCSVLSQKSCGRKPNCQYDTTFNLCFDWTVTPAPIVTPAPSQAICSAILGQKSCQRKPHCQWEAAFNLCFDWTAVTPAPTPAVTPAPTQATVVDCNSVNNLYTNDMKARKDTCTAQQSCEWNRKKSKCGTLKCKKLKTEADCLLRSDCKVVKKGTKIKCT